MRIPTTIVNRLGLVTKAQAQERVNSAREDGREPSRTNQPLYKAWDADMRPGMMPYSVLRGFAENCEPVRLCINRVKAMMHTLTFTVAPVDEDDPDESQLAAAKAWFTAEGGVGKPGTMLEEFIDELVEDLLVCGCISTYQRRNVGREMISVEAIDAATFIPLRDNKGWIPEPPAPAYKQVLRGQGVGKEFTRDEILYRIWGARTFTPYGQSFVECCMGAILQYNAADAYNLRWYTDGDSVLGYWQYTGQGDAGNGQPTPAEIASFDAWLKKNEAKARQKGKPLADLRAPAGWKYTSFRPRTEADYLETEKRLFARIAPFFGLTPSSLGLESDTYKSAEASMREQSIANALRPIAQFLGGVFTALIQGPLGFDRCRGYFDLDIIDLQQISSALATIGTNTLSANERRVMLGQPKLSGGLADELYEVTPLGLLVIASTDPEKQIETPVVTGEVIGNGSADDGRDEAGTDGQRGNGDAGGGVAKATDPCRADLYRWRTKVRKAAHTGKEPGQVRFQSEVIPPDVQEQIHKALATGDVDAAFEPHLRSGWDADLGRGLDGLIAHLEQAAQEKGVRL